MDRQDHGPIRPRLLRARLSFDELERRLSAEPGPGIEHVTELPSDLRIARAPHAPLFESLAAQFKR
jgi:hypothetical protein